MPLNMSKIATIEYIFQMRRRYKLLRGKKAKGQLLNEIVTITGYDRKQAIRLMKQRAQPYRKRKQGGRPPLLNEQDIEIIKRIWFASEQPCGKRLHALLPTWLPWIKQEGCPLKEDQTKHILKASPATLDRVLAPYKSGKKRINRLTLNQIKQAIPLRSQLWEVTECGWSEIDTVAHGGCTTRGNFVWTLTLTDIWSGWTELRAVWNKGRHGITSALENIRNNLPFPLKGIDSDNGSEFLNGHLMTYWKNLPDPPLLTRSRPYHKNDNAHVEEKNRTHVRNLIGYDRLDQEECVELVNNIYEIWNTLNNYYLPAMKLVFRKREGHRIIKQYDTPRTPWQRVRENRGTSYSSVLKRNEIINPFELKEELEKRLLLLHEWKEIRRKESEELWRE